MSTKFFIVEENRVPQYDKRYVRLLKKYDGCQMVLTNLNPPEVKNEIRLLDEKHIKDVYDLVWLVMPGFYRMNSFLMGDFYGIFEDNKLVAVSGQRMQGHEFIEISAVVTHPAYTRRGYAGQLVAHVTKEILKTDKLPILHTTKGNPAINLYNKLGFETTRDMNWWHYASREA